LPVARIVEPAVAAAGVDEKLFSGHSLRAGLALDAREDPLRDHEDHPASE
jgi:hypothetical protein